jgi:hypothetical protein
MNISGISSTPSFTAVVATKAAAAVPPKVDRDHDGDNDTTESKGAAAAEASKSSGVLDIKA